MLAKKALTARRRVRHHDAISAGPIGNARAYLANDAGEFVTKYGRRHDHARVIAALINFQIGDRKSTRLNSSHMSISYAVFCLKKKKTSKHTLCTPCIRVS